MAAQMMRRILVDAARARGSQKRGGGARNVNIDETTVLSTEPDQSILPVDEALTEFARLATPSQGRRIELFRRPDGGGLAVLKISPRTVRRNWDLARAWLLREVSHTIGKPSVP